MLADWFNYTQSSGYFSGGAISDDGDGTITVAAGSGIIKITDSPIGVTEFFTWSANTSLVMIDNGVNYVYVDYSAGTPVSKTTTDRTSIEQNRMFTLGRVYRAGTSIHIIQSGVLLYNFLRREHERTLALRGFERVSGGVVTETGTRNLATTVGSFYFGLNAVATTAQDTSGTDKFTYWYRAAGAGWTKVVDQTQIDNTQYDDGDGTLGTLTANRYGVHWVFIHFDSDVHVVYGQGDYTLANAEKAALPTDLPDAVSAFGILAAKIIIQKSAASFNSIVSAYVVTLQSVFTNADAVAAVEAAGLDFDTTKSLGFVDDAAGVFADRIYDEDDMASDDEHGLATQQSTKVYVDSKLTLPTWPTSGIVMTRDGAFHDVDISATYGAKKHLVFLYLYTTDAATGQTVALRPKGSADVTTFVAHQVANIAGGYFAQVQTDSDGVWQYRALAGLTSAEYRILTVLTP